MLVIYLYIYIYMIVLMRWWQIEFCLYIIRLHHGLCMAKTTIPLLQTKLQLRHRWNMTEKLYKYECKLLPRFWVMLMLNHLQLQQEQNYSSLSNKRDDHDTLTSPKVTLITLLLASITHKRGARRAHKFFKFKDQNSKWSLKWSLVVLNPWSLWSYICENDHRLRI